MKKVLYCTIFLSSIATYAQVGINTETPNSTFDVVATPSNITLPDGIIPPRMSGVQLLAKDNAYNSLQTAALVYVTSPFSNTSPKTINVNQVGYYYFDGSVWQKFTGNGSVQEINAINGLTKIENDIKLGGNLNEVTTIGTSSTNTLRLTGLQSGDASTDKILVVDGNGTVKSVNDVSNDLSIPSPAIFTLNADQNNFLNGVANGGSAVVNMVETKNTIPGLTYVASTRTINFPTGVYQMTFVYEGMHNATGCTISSYIVDFPTNAGAQRIHSTAYHNQGGLSNHGGTITYVTNLTSPKPWQIRLGRGQSGNCSGGGNVLAARSTQLLIFRIGD